MDKTKLVTKIIHQICPLAQIEATTELIDSGILTSLDLFNLIVELETAFDFRMDESLIAAENFVTAEKIAQVILQGVDC